LEQGAELIPKPGSAHDHTVDRRGVGVSAGDVRRALDAQR
jgi:hypothetical protein